MDSALERRLPLLLRQFPKLDRDFIERAAEADPAPGKGNVTWILRMVVKEAVRLPEDVNKLQERLAAFERLKKLPAFQGKRDIGAYGDYAELAQAVEGAIDVRSRGEEFRHRATEGCQLIAENGRFQVFSITTAEAARLEAKGTEWCTKDPATTEGYLEQGPLFVVYESGKKFAQVHAETGQWNDVWDRALPWSAVHEIHGLLTPSLNDEQSAAEGAMGYLRLLEGHFRAEKGNEQSDFRKCFDHTPYEAEIAEDAEQSLDYAAHPFGGNPHRFPLGEPAILLQPKLAARYAVEVLKGPWQEAEEVIARDAQAACYYAGELLAAPWPPIPATANKRDIQGKDARGWYMRGIADCSSDYVSSFEFSPHLDAAMAARYAKDMALASQVVAGATAPPSTPREAVIFQAAARFLASDKEERQSWERAENFLVYCPLPVAAVLVREYAEVAAGARWLELEKAARVNGMFDPAQAILTLREWRADAPFWTAAQGASGCEVLAYRTTEERQKFQAEAPERRVAALRAAHEAAYLSRNYLPAPEEPDVRDDLSFTL